MLDRMLRVIVLIALLSAGCKRPPPPAAPVHPQVTAPGEVFNAYRIQDRPVDARLLAESVADRPWQDDGWSVWWHDGVLWVHRVTCGRCRAIQGWTYVVLLADPGRWREVTMR
jgi:hypothetical protein